MDAVRHFKLKNQGAFAARLHVNYRLAGEDSWRTWKPSGYADICAGAEREQDLKEIDIPDGALVRLIAFVTAGSGKMANEEYIFFSNTGRMATYIISGTTLLSKLRLERYG